MQPQSPEPDIQVEIGPGDLPELQRSHRSTESTTSQARRRSQRRCAPSPENTPIDLSECSFVDSTVISTSLSASRELEREGHPKPRVLPEIGWMDVGAGIGVGRRDVGGGRRG